MSDSQDIKEQAITYYQENKVPLRMQDVLNVMFQVNPPDVNGFVSTYFEQHAHAPTISRALAVKSLDSKGQPTVVTKLYCLIRNNEHLIDESEVCVDTQLMENAKVEDKEIEDECRAKEVEEAIMLINNEFQDMLVSAEPQNQKMLDETVYQLIESRRLKAKQQEEELRETAISTPQGIVDDGKKGAKKSAKGSGKKKNPQVQLLKHFMF